MSSFFRSLCSFILNDSNILGKVVERTSSTVPEFNHWQRVRNRNILIINRREEMMYLRAWSFLLIAKYYFICLLWSCLATSQDRRPIVFGIVRTWYSRQFRLWRPYSLNRQDWQRVWERDATQKQSEQSDGLQISYWVYSNENTRFHIWSHIKDRYQYEIWLEIWKVVFYSKEPNLALRRAPSPASQEPHAATALIFNMDA